MEKYQVSGMPYCEKGSKTKYKTKEGMQRGLHGGCVGLRPECTSLF